MVRLYEYQGKQLLRDAGVPLPDGEVVSASEDAREAHEEIGDPVVIKSQIWATGRLKVGGIKFADTPDETEEIAEELLGSEVKGHKVEKVLVEQQIDIDKEFFGSIIADDSYKVKGPRIILSSKGGVDIEQVSKESPEKVSHTTVDVREGLPVHKVYEVATDLGFERDHLRPLAKIISGLYSVFREADARSAEINPIVATEDGDLYAADCRIAMDDASAFRHPEFEFGIPRDMTRKPTELEKIAWSIEEADYRGVAYFTQMNPEPPEDKKNGYIAFHSIGGGSAMKSADVLIDHDFVMANYTDSSGNPTASKVYRVAKVALNQPEIEGYLVMAPTIANQDQWHHAHGFVKAFREELKDKEDFPVIILICGNKEEESIEILKEGLSDLPINYEVYGRDHFHELDFLSERMKEMIEDYRERRND